MQITKEQVEEQLAQVMDPELNMAVTELGLIYGVDISPKGKIKITMTLTTLGCPLFSVIENEVKNKLGILGVKDKDVEIELTFEPPWSMERMSERAKAMLGI